MKKRWAPACSTCSPARPMRNAREPLPARSVTYSTSPLLASKTPPWRSKFIVVGGGELHRAARPRALHPGAGQRFFQKKGEIRFAHATSICRPAAAASWTATARSWPSACPRRRSRAILKDLDADRNQRRQLARALGMHAPPSSTMTAAPDPRLPGCAARSTNRSAGRAAPGIKGAPGARVQAQVPRRARPLRTWSVRPTPTSAPGGRRTRARARAGGQRRQAPRHQGSRGPRRRDIGESVEPVDGRDRAPDHRSEDPVLRLPAHRRDAVNENRASERQRGGARRGQPAACWRWPTTRDRATRQRTGDSARCATRARRHRRARLDHEALHRRAGAGVGRVTPTDGAGHAAPALHHRPRRITDEHLAADDDGRADRSRSPATSARPRWR